MKFVALVSGGKDSLFSIAKAKEYGHELICIANLAPMDSSTIELNSFMYQSAGHNLVPLISECLGVPLYRKSITGSAIDQTLSYSDITSGDEVEDLYDLLQSVLRKHPNINAITTGAIASTYQRLRVEDVCSRLRLQSLCYLWQRDRSELLDEMVESGLEAVLVKVAGAGLSPRKHLGKSLKNLNLELRRLNAKYGLDLCGEGGEYESFVLDMPMFKYSISILKSEVLVDAEDESVGNLHIDQYALVTKTPSNSPIDNAFCSTGERKFLSDISATLKHIDDVNLNLSPERKYSKMRLPSTIDQSLTCPVVYDISSHSSSIGCSTMVCDLPDLPTYLDASESPSQAASRQINAILVNIKQQLTGKKLGLENVYYVHLYLSDINLFQPVNEEYCKFFGKNPPSRTCVALPFPPNHNVSVRAYFSIRTSHVPRRVLHVMSISEWAPSCIGPYSQANVVGDSLIFLAGQIPLTPGLMTPVEFGASDLSSLKALAPRVTSWHPASWWTTCCFQVAACIRHVSKLLESLDTSTCNLISFIVYVNVGPCSPLFGVADTLAFECISKLASLLLIGQCRVTRARNDDQNEDEDIDDEVPADVQLPAISVVGVHGLPRNCLVEVEAAALTASVATERIKCIRKGNCEIEFTEFTASDARQMLRGAVPIESLFPFWNSDVSTAHSPCDPAPFSPITMKGGNMRHIRSYIKFYPRALSFGAFTLSFGAEVALQCVAYVVVSFLRDYLIESETNFESIKRVRISISSPIDESLATSSLEYYFQILMGIKNCPVILLPTMATMDISASLILSVSWEAFDLDIIHAEKWLNKCS